MGKDTELTELLEQAVKESVEAQKKPSKTGWSLAYTLAKKAMAVTGTIVMAGVVGVGAIYGVYQFSLMNNGGIVASNPEAALQDLVAGDNTAKDTLSRYFNEKSDALDQISYLAFWEPATYENYLNVVRAECGSKLVVLCGASVRERILGAYNGYLPSKSFLEWDTPLLNKVVTKLHDDSYLQEKSALWPELDAGERLESVQYILDTQLGVYAADGLPVQDINIKLLSGEDNYTAWYSRAAVTEASISFNEKYFDSISFDTAMMAALHEGRHHVQDVLRMELKSDVGAEYLKQNNIVADAMIMDFVFENKIQYNDRDANLKMAWYHQHPHEVDAHYYEERVSEALERKAKRTVVMGL